mmetsp:Transcript_55153/g.96573  ORF Transcript_55153/g.96573 Transcript_55153/m.96573 type:complete len:203 (+) Transcript_55153:23-631(+)
MAAFRRARVLADHVLTDLGKEEFVRKDRQEQSNVGYHVPTSSECITRGIKVCVQSAYLPVESSCSPGVWQWSYNVTISNESSKSVQLLTQNWIITDAGGNEEHVGQAPGVLGRQPVLQPGQSFSYKSVCPLRTSFGTVYGSYMMNILEDWPSEHGKRLFRRTPDRFEAHVELFGLTTDGQDAIMPIVMEAPAIEEIQEEIQG